MQSPHVFENIHQITVIYNMIMMYIFVVIGASFIQILSGGFFIFDPPFTISDKDFTSVAVLLIYIFFAMIEQIMTVIGEEFANVSGMYPPDANVMRELASIMLGVVIFWQKLVFKYIVIRSQFAIIIAVVIVDLLTTLVFKDYIIRKRMGLINFLLDFGLIPDKARDNTEAFYRMKIIHVLAECFTVFVMGMVYLLTGTTDSLYFSMSMPVDLIGHMVGNESVPIVLCFVIFLDQVGYGLLRRIIEDWFDTHIKHPDMKMAETALTPMQIMFVHIVKRVLYWSRLIFSLSFLTTRYYFVIPYTFGDVVSGVAKYCYFTFNKHDKTDKKEKAEVRRMQANVLIFGALFMIAELILIAMVMVIPDYVDSQYFEWPDFLEIFRNIITGQNEIIVILIYSGFFQIGATLINEIVIPDFNNWMYGKSSESYVCCYHYYHRLFIIMLVRFDSWFRFIIIVQFVLSNLYLVVVVGLVDLFVGSIIIYHYINIKQNQEKIDECGREIDTLFDDDDD